METRHVGTIHRLKVVYAKEQQEDEFMEEFLSPDNRERPPCPLDFEQEGGWNGIGWVLAFLVVMLSALGGVVLFMLAPR